MELIEGRRSSWLAKALQSTPKLIRTPKRPIAVINVARDATSFQGWRTVVNDKPESICNRPLSPGDSFILDFGEHITGQLILSLRSFEVPVDAPVRLSLIFGEVPAEIAESFDPYLGGLTRPWLQDEVVNLDEVPQTVTLPRRYAFRYVKVSVVSCSTYGKFGFSGIRAEAVSSADESRLLPFAAQREGRVVGPHREADVARLHADSFRGRAEARPPALAR